VRFECCRRRFEDSERSMAEQVGGLLSTRVKPGGPFTPPYVTRLRYVTLTLFRPVTFKDFEATLLATSGIPQSTGDLHAANRVNRGSPDALGPRCYFA